MLSHKHVKIAVTGRRKLWTVEQPLVRIEVFKEAMTTTTGAPLEPYPSDIRKHAERDFKILAKEMHCDANLFDSTLARVAKTMQSVGVDTRQREGIDPAGADPTKLLQMKAVAN